MNDQQKEIDRLKECLAWATSVHAATMECLPKRTSIHERDRHRNIARILVKFLSGESVERRGYHQFCLEDTIAQARDRAEKAIERENHFKPRPESGKTGGEGAV